MSHGHDLLSNAIRQQARLAMGDMSNAAIGTISSYDQSTHSVKIEIGADKILSNWMPLGAIGIGSGWGVAVGPQIGDQVMAVFEGGDYSSGVIVARIFSVAQQAIPVPSGEIWMLHKDGSLLKFLAGGNVEAHVAGNLAATVAGDASLAVAGNITSSATLWTHTGPVTVNGFLTGTQGFSFTGSTGGGPTGYVTGAIHYNGVQITADAGSTQTFNGKRIDDMLRVTGIQPGASNSGTPV